MKDPVELIMVTGENNNKFYRMFDTDDGNFRIEYGRVGVTSIPGSYPISQWDAKYREKIKKGYRDVSDLKATTIAGNLSFNSTDVEHFYSCFSRYTKESPFQGFTYYLGREYISELTTTKDPNDVTGFCNIDIQYLQKHYTRSWDDKVYDGTLKCYELGFHSILPYALCKFLKIFDDDTVYKCIIPKGSTYVEDFVGCVVSTNIIIKEIRR